jgi:hypothetical protein
VILDLYMMQASWFGYLLFSDGYQSWIREAGAQDVGSCTHNSFFLQYPGALHSELLRDFRFSKQFICIRYFQPCRDSGRCFE